MEIHALVNYFKSAYLDKPVDELIKGPIISLLGVTDNAKMALENMGIQSVLDLAFSELFKYAEVISQETNSVFLKTKQFPSILFDANAIDNIDFEDVKNQDIKIFKSISDATAQTIRNALSVNKIRDLALWPPFLAAKEIVNTQYGLGISNINDPESPQDLIPKTGEYPVEVIYYNTFVLAHAPESNNTIKLEDSGPIEIKFDEKVSGFEKPGWGAILKYSQQWFAEGITLGNLIKCIPLGPGETTKIAIIDWQRTTRGAATEDITQSEQLSNELTQKRAINEIAEATATETQSGFSGSAAVSTSSSAGIGGGTLMYGGLIGGTASNGTNVTGSNSYSTSSGEKNISSSLQQNIDNSTHQNSFSARNKRASIVTELSETQTETITTRTLTNYNHMHALTLQYWQVVQIFRTEVKLEKYQRTLYIPLKPFDFRNNENIINRFKTILIRAAHSEYVRSLLIASLGNVNFEFSAYNPGEAFNKEADPTLSEKEKLKQAKDIAKEKAKQIAKEKAKEAALFNLYKNSELISDYDANRRTWKMPGAFQLNNIRWSSDQATKIESVLINIEDGADIEVKSNGSSFNSNSINPYFNGLIPFALIEGISVKLSSASTENTVHKLELQFDTGGGIFKQMAFNFMIAKNKDSELVLDITPPQRTGELGAALNEQALYYSQQIWLNMDIHFLTLMLSKYTFRTKRIVEYIDPKPVSVAGNCLAFIWKDADQVSDQEWKQWITDQIDLTKITRQRVALPTDGVFAEAVLGRFNSAEKLDITRFWNWQDSPIPFSAPDIAAIQSGQQQAGNVPSIGNLESPVLNIMNPAPLPDPTGMQAVNNSLAANIFRDMSGMAQTAALAQAALHASSQGATAAGSQAGANMATFANFYTEMARIAASLAPMLIGLPPAPLTGGKNITNAGAALNAAQNIDSTGSASGNSSPGNSLPLTGGGVNSGRSSGLPGESGGTISGGNTVLARNRGETGSIMDMISGNRENLFNNSTISDQTIDNVEYGSINLPLNINEWSDLFNHIVPRNIVNELATRRLEVLALESAFINAALNLDLYEVEIITMPKKDDGSVYSHIELFKDLRLNFHLFTAKAHITFEGIEGEDDIQWKSDHFLGTAMMFSLGDSMGVVASHSDQLAWIFTTIKDTDQTPFIKEEVGVHPVSGNRMFGLSIDNGKVKFFTKGVDRTTTKLNTLAGESFVFKVANFLWANVQSGVKEFIENRQGVANVLAPVSSRFNYRLAKEKLLRTNL